MTRDGSLMLKYNMAALRSQRKRVREDARYKDAPAPSPSTAGAREAQKYAAAAKEAQRKNSGNPASH